MGKQERLPSVQMGTWVLAVMPIDIDAVNSPELGDELAALLRHGGIVLIADLTRTGFCDSCGVRMLVLAHRQAAEYGCELRLVVPTDGVRRILALTGADQVLQVFETMTEALADAPDGVHAASGEHEAAQG